MTVRLLIGQVVLPSPFVGRDLSLSPLLRLLFIAFAAIALIRPRLGWRRAVFSLPPRVGLS